MAIFGNLRRRVRSGRLSGPPLVDPLAIHIAVRAIGRRVDADSWQIGARRSRWRRCEGAPLVFTSQTVHTPAPAPVRSMKPSLTATDLDT
jgi:hypothetical protein